MFGPAEIEALWLSLKVASLATVLTLPLALWLAHGLSRKGFGPAYHIVNTLVYLPLVLPPVVTGYVLLLLFGRAGPIGGVLGQLGLSVAFHWTGAALAAGVMALPLMVRALRLALDQVDPNLIEAARTLGASPLRVYLRVHLPLMSPGIAAAVILGFAKALGEFGATITFVSNIPGLTQTLPSAIYTFLQIPGEENAALRLVILCIVISVGALAASEWMTRAAVKRVTGQ